MIRCLAALICVISFSASTLAEQWIPVGAGKILVGAKPSHESPKDAEYRSGAMRQQALPTNSWFSSLTYMQWSGVLHAHPLSFKATEQGFEMGLPEKAVEPIEAIKAWAWPPPPGRPIASVVHRHVAALTVRPKHFQPADARLSAKGDWSISVDMTEPEGDRRLRAHIGHGIPYGFFEVSDGAVVIELEDGGIWDADVVTGDNKQIIYAAVRDVTYAVYLPSDASVHAVDGLRLEVTLGADARYFSMAAVIGEYESLQQPASVPSTIDAAQNIDPVFVEAATVIDVGPGGMKAIDARATDADGDTVTYTIEGPDAALFEVATDGSVRFKPVIESSGSGSHKGSNSYTLTVVANDGNGGTATQSLTINMADGAGLINSYDRLTLDWAKGAADVNPNWVFGGAVSSAASHEGADVLRFTHPKGAEGWAGVALIEAQGGTDLIADRAESVTMRVWAETDGAVTLAMEDISSISPNSGATRYLSVTENVIGGRWNDLAFDFSDPDSAAGDDDTDHNKLVLKVNEGNTLFVDRIDLVGADIIDAPERPASAGPVRPTRDISDLLAGHAFAFVTGTSVRWDYSETESKVTTRYSFDVNPMDGIAVKPLVGLYPHHWMQLAPGTELSDYALPSVRGPIRMAAVDSFETELPFGGLLPVWPVTGSEAELRDLGEFLIGDTRRTASLYTGHGNGTYWTGKALGSIAQLILVSEQIGQDDRAEALELMLKDRMEKWFRGEGGFYFGFHKNVGSLVGYPEEYFSASGMNDHHFHYGYWLMAAAHIAKRDPGWLTPSQWGQMVQLIARDIATSERGRDDFPFIRNFDPYEGHSWARGNSDFFGHGNDQESSSEAINAWAALAFLGEFTGNRQMRDLGVYLYVTEIASVLNYWFDIHGVVFDPKYPKPIASMVFGGGYGYSTWWTEEPRQIHGINLLPITSASVYLAQIPPERALSDIAFMKARRAEYETAAQTDGTPSVIWENVFVSWLALNDPDLALETWNPDADGSMELGDTRSRTLAWTLTMKHFGTPDLTVKADTLMYGIFRRDDGNATYCAYNATTKDKVVTYTDGVTLLATPSALTCN